MTPRERKYHRRRKDGSLWWAKRTKPTQWYMNIDGHEVPIKDLYVMPFGGTPIDFKMHTITIDDPSIFDTLN